MAAVSGERRELPGSWKLSATHWLSSALEPVHVQLDPALSEDSAGQEELHARRGGQRLPGGGAAGRWPPSGPHG